MTSPAAASAGAYDPIAANRDVFNSQFTYDGHISAKLKATCAELEQPTNAAATCGRCILLHCWQYCTLASTGMAHARVAGDLRQLLKQVWPALLDGSNKSAAAASSSSTMPSWTAEDQRDLNLRHPTTGCTLLMLVSRDARRPKIGGLLNIRQLLQYGADPSVADNRGLRAVHHYVCGDIHATAPCSKHIVEQLLAGGDAALLRASDTCSLLHSAVQLCLPQIVSLLLKRGASPWERDRDGYLPVDYLDTEPFPPADWSKQDLQLMFRVLFLQMRKENKRLQAPPASPQHSQRPKYCRQRHEGAGLLHLAAIYGDLDTLRCILKIQPTQATAVTRREEWPAHLAFAEIKRGDANPELEERCCILLDGALKVAKAPYVSFHGEQSVLAPLLTSALQHSFQRCIDRLLVTRDPDLLRHRVGYSSKHSESASLLAECRTCEQFLQLLPHLRAAGADVRDAFAIAASRLWTKAAVDRLSEDDVDINWLINSRIPYDVRCFWAEGSNVLHADFARVGGQQEDVFREQMLDLLVATLRHPTTTVKLNCSIRDKSGCTPLLALAKNCCYDVNDRYLSCLDLLLQLPVDVNFADSIPRHYDSNAEWHIGARGLLDLALNVPSHRLLLRVLSDDRSAVLFATLDRIEVTKRAVQRVEEWAGVRQPALVAGSYNLRRTTTVSLDAASALQLVDLLQQRFFGYEAHVRDALEAVGLYEVLQHLVFDFLFGGQPRMQRRQLMEIVDQMRQRLTLPPPEQVQQHP